ncbi:MAG: type II toxin-antitoxin system VapC family toxin [Acidobacteriota bacterium]
MIVVDASAILDLLLRTFAAPAIEDRLFATGESLHAPHLLDLEVVQVLRRYSRAGELGATRGQQALEDLAALPITRYPHDLFVLRIWARRHNLSAYDAAYLRGAGRDPWRHAAHAGRAAARGAGGEGNRRADLKTSGPRLPRHCGERLDKR